MMETLDLFADEGQGGRDAIGPCAFVLRRFALPRMEALLREVAGVERRSPFRHMVTPGGHTMSVALTNCGDWGWVTDRRGYRYTRSDPDTGRPWPAMPTAFAGLARTAAARAGFDAFEPDACLINLYLPGARMALHQDKDEADFSAPIVSVSLGMAATFLFGGHRRSDRPARLALCHGDVVVWGGEDRLRYHGVMPVQDDPHPLLGSRRINFTFRKAG